MKKGVVILSSLILGLVFCLPAVAQPNTRAVETIVIDNFDTDKEWTWAVQASRFITDGYPIVKKFEGIPNSLTPYHKDDDPTAMVLGTKAKFDRKGDNWFEVYPKKDDKNYEIPFVGTVTQIDFWVWGANYNYFLEVLVRDANGSVHILQAGSLAFHGWKNIIINVPGWLQQQSKLRSGPENMTFVGFRIRSDAEEYVDDFVVFFDQIKYITNSLSVVYDGYELKDANFDDENEGAN